MEKSGIQRGDLVDNTVYTLRIATSPYRGSSMTDTSSGVMVCLIGQRGDALLKYIPCLENARDADEQLRNICLESNTIPRGADCSLIMGSPAPAADGSGGFAVHRFQSGAVNEVCFADQDIGPLEAMIVGPQSGTWGCEEVTVSSSADMDGGSTRFLSREKSQVLGSSPEHSAAYMMAVPQGAVVYGEGESAKILTSSEALSLATKNMAWYSDMKKKLLFYTATVGVLGTTCTYGFLGSGAAASFAAGTVASFIYQVGLQKRVDTIGDGHVPDTYSLSASFDSPMPEQQVGKRLKLVIPLIGVSTLLCVLLSRHEALVDTSDIGSFTGIHDNFGLTMTLLAGFASQKLAVILFSLEGMGSLRVVDATLTSSGDDSTGRQSTSSGKKSSEDPPTSFDAPSS